MNLKRVCSILAILSFLFLAACVTEQRRGGPGFKEPTAEELQKALAYYVQIAYGHLEKGETENAMESLKQAQEIDEDSPLLITAFAVTYERQGDMEKAEQFYKKAISQDRKFSPARMNYGSFLFKAKKYKQACTQFKKAANDDFYEKRSGAFLNYGICLKTLGDTEGALNAFQRSVALDPYSNPPLFELALMQWEREDYATSKKTLDEYFNIARKTGYPVPAKALWLGIRLERKFDNKDAEASLGLLLKNFFPYSREYLLYKDSLGK